MRVITGKAKGIQLKTLQGNETRPTSDRVKEAVFSMIQFDLDGRTVLDLFSGSGQLAIEALSRGANEAVMVDKSKNAVSIIKENVDKANLSSQCSIYQSDYIDFIKKNKGKQFDIIFLDPPYAQKLYRPALKTMLENDFFKPSTLIICESGNGNVFEGDKMLENSFVIEKQSRYGNTYITIFKIAQKETI